MQRLASLGERGARSTPDLLGKKSSATRQRIGYCIIVRMARMFGIAARMRPKATANDKYDECPLNRLAYDIASLVHCTQSSLR